MPPLLIRCLLAGLLLAPTIPPLAAQPAALAGEVAVADRSAATRAQALPAVLADALQRLTPVDDPAAKVDLDAALAEGSTLLQRFEYAQVTKPTASGIPSIKLMLRAWFDPVPARNLLVQAGVPVWPGGGLAPSAWVVEGGGEELRLLDGGSEPRLDAFRTALARRGVQPLWAVNDLEDWQMSRALAPATAASSLAQAAARTAAPLALLAWVSTLADGQGIQVDWYLHGGGDERRFTSTGADLEAALAEGGPRLVALLGELAAVQPGAAAASGREIDRGAGDYVVWIENLGQGGDYADAVALLQAQPPVSAVVPEQAAGDRIRLRISLTAPLGQLLALLAADGRLELQAAPPGGADLSLRWRE
jgi:hypothetical protein